MAKKTLEPLPKYWTIGRAEHINVLQAMKRPLSGYIGGQSTEGYFVKLLSDRWRDEFQCDYAVPCNSATSGLMAACMAAGIRPGDEVWCSTYTMSASATCAMILGAKVRFMDIDRTFFGISGILPSPNLEHPKAIIVTNLFGCAADLVQLRHVCDEHNIVLIEDNAQAPYATYGGRFTGTIGHMGVFSLNVHKHIQCHGELGYRQIMGGNFRMTEPIAAIACAQLKKARKLVQTRIDLAEAITDIFKQVSFVEPPIKRSGEVHAYYLWAGKIVGSNPRDIRQRFVTKLNERGVPFRIGYAPLLHKLFGEIYPLPVAEEMENERLFTFEICAYDPKVHHLKRMRDIILEEAEALEKE